MEAELIMNVKEMQNRKAWLQLRKLGIGGSDAGTIMGYNPWSSPFKLWLEKTGQVELEDISNKPSVQAGIRLEPVVADWFADETGLKVERRGMMRNKTYPWMQANIDRLIPGKKNGLDADIGLEIKTTNAFSAHEWDGDELPASYLLQCQHYMMATGLKGWWIAVLIGGQDFRKKFIPRNDEQIKALFEAEKEFWDVNVKMGVMPDIDGSDATAEMLKKQYPGGCDDVLDLPGDALNIITLIDGYKARQKEIDGAIETYENQLKAMMGDHEVGTVDTMYKVTWKTRAGRKTFDTKRFRADHPDLYDEYVKVGEPTRDKHVRISAKKGEK
ncbi:YqaJ viral recombinase family nuclease [Megasphaera elsdenii]|uniref:YqaJ viral recombinase family nuclease n=1 Tax=Megasphaera elsdenii TaxID=907 RepID=UPI002430E349|nr:YqaJ viral recombinase family protein [Megasphaera elsdenii]